MPFVTTTHRRPVPFWVVWCLEQDDNPCSQQASCAGCFPTRAYRLLLVLLSLLAMSVGTTMFFCFLFSSLATPQKQAAIGLAAAGLFLCCFTQALEINWSYCGCTPESLQQQSTINIHITPVVSAAQ